MYDSIGNFFRQSD